MLDCDMCTMMGYKNSAVIALHCLTANGERSTLAACAQPHHQNLVLRRILRSEGAEWILLPAGADLRDLAGKLAAAPAAPDATTYIVD